MNPDDLLRTALYLASGAVRGGVGRPRGVLLLPLWQEAVMSYRMNRHPPLPGGVTCVVDHEPLGRRASSCGTVTYDTTFWVAS